VMEGYKGTNLSGFDGVTYSPAIATFSHSPWHRPAFDCKRDRATNDDTHCHPIAHPNDTARLQCALRPSQHPFTRCFMLMSWVLHPPRSPPQLHNSSSHPSLKTPLACSYTRSISLHSAFIASSLMNGDGLTSSSWYSSEMWCTCRHCGSCGHVRGLRWTSGTASTASYTGS